jgi:hypothetical protein
MTVRELLERTTSQELTEWAAYERTHGTLGRERHDVLVGHSMALLANVNRDPKKSKSYSSKDFIPQWQRRRQSWQDMKAIAKAITKLYGGRIREGGDHGGTE